jgi:hypothetical protein
VWSGAISTRAVFLLWGMPVTTLVGCVLCSLLCSPVCRAWEDRSLPEPLLGRGGHQMLAIKHKNGDPYLYVFGGRGGDNTVQNRPQVVSACFTCEKLWKHYVSYIIVD